MLPMILKDLELQDFKSFIGKHAFNFFEGQPGFYYVTGVNEAEPRLGANATGKSTLLVDALLWAFYGKTARGLKAGNIAPWASYGKKTKPSVTVRFQIGGESWILHRSRNPNKLQLYRSEESPQNAVQTDIDTLLGMDYTAAVSAVFMRQIGDVFFDMRPGERMELFSTVFNLERWDAASTRAGRKAAEIEGQIASLQKDLSYAEGNMEQVKKALRTLKERSKKWEVEKETELGMLEAELPERSVELVQAIKVLRSAATEKKTRKSGLVLLEKKIDGLNRSLRDFDQRIATERAEYRAKQKEFDRVKEDKEDVQELIDNDWCPTCGQAMDESHLPEIKEKYQKEMDRIAKDAQQHRKNWEKMEKQKAKKEKAYSESLQRRRRKVQEQEKQEGVVRKAENNVAAARSDLADLLATYQNELEMENPYTEEIFNKGAEYKQLEKTLLRLHSEIEQLEADQSRLEFWKSGFKEVRLYISQKALEQLEIEINNALVHLGLENDWEITLDIEKATQSGSVKRGLMIFVKNSNSDKSTPWEAWSGGESQRLRLAGNMGISELVRSNCGVSPSFEVWDEPTTHMNPQGVDEMLSLLAERSRETQRQIWLVEHNALDSGRFDRTITVRKDTKGSHIEVE